MPKKQEYLYRLHTPLTKDLMSYLDNAGLTAREGGGLKIAKTTIIRAMVRAVMELDVDYEGIRDEEELYQKITEAMKKYK